ncbi:hypothetical protein NQ317_003385 [Molorchus minor]|uniref:Uncharacterized protein n=1 Tax=Molorchus minor TaxID=1323400 RepID=A0ABQ9K986_9CUCU|nr:hypothetical protein NQ317_003385 [Molorchus minor]
MISCEENSVVNMKYVKDRCIQQTEFGEAEDFCSFINTTCRSSLWISHRASLRYSSLLKENYRRCHHPAKLAAIPVGMERTVEKIVNVEITANAQKERGTALLLATSPEWVEMRREIKGRQRLADFIEAIVDVLEAMQSDSKR